jgi:hypothetical protein
MFAWSKDFPRIGDVDSHCSYQRPDSSSSREDHEMPIDLGFRYLNDEHACIYKVVYAGRDEYGRKGNFFAHTLMFSIADLEAIDADIPALFAWAYDQSVFSQNTCYENGEEVFNSVPADDGNLPEIHAPFDWLHDWREREDQQPLVNQLQSYPPGDVEQIARTTFQLALLPESERRSVVWIGSNNGFDNSKQARDVVFLLFVALPFAWRKNATFSTHRKNINKKYQWLGATNDRPGFSREQKNYELYVLNGVAPAESSNLPATFHPLAEQIMANLHQPPNDSGLSRLRRFGNQFCPLDGEVYGDRGFFYQLEQSRLTLAGRGENFEALANLMSRIRLHNPEPFQLLLRYLIAKGAFKDFSIPQVSKLTESFISVLKSQETEKFDEECLGQVSSVAERIFLCALSKAFFPEAVKLKDFLRSTPGLEGVYSGVGSRLATKCAAAISKTPNASFIYRMNELLSRELLAENRTEEFATCQQAVRDSFVSEPDAMDDRLAERAEVSILPHLTISCRTITDLESGLRLLVAVRQKTGTDFVIRFLEQCLPQIPTSEIQSIPSDHRHLLFEFTPELTAVKHLLSSIADQLGDEKAISLSDIYWEHSTSFTCEKRLLSERLLQTLTDKKCSAKEITDLGERYREYGASKLADQLEKHVQHSVPLTVPDYAAQVKLIELGLRDAVQPPSDEVARHAENMLLLIHRCGSSIPSAERSAWLKVLAQVPNSAWNKPPESYFDAIRRLGWRYRSWIAKQDGECKLRSLARKDWPAVASELCSQPHVALVMTCCLDVAAYGRNNADCNFGEYSDAVVGRLYAQQPVLASGGYQLELSEEIKRNLKGDGKLVFLSLQSSVRDLLKNRPRVEQCLTWLNSGYPGYPLLVNGHLGWKVELDEFVASTLEKAPWFVSSRVHRGLDNQMCRQTVLQNNLIPALAEMSADQIEQFPADRLDDLRHAIGSLPRDMSSNRDFPEALVVGVVKSLIRNPNAIALRKPISGLLEDYLQGCGFFHDPLRLFSDDELALLTAWSYELKEFDGSEQSEKQPADDSALLSWLRDRVHEAPDDAAQSLGRYTFAMTNPTSDAIDESIALRTKIALHLWYRRTPQKKKGWFPVPFASKGRGRKLDDWFGIYLGNLDSGKSDRENCRAAGVALAWFFNASAYDLNKLGLAQCEKAKDRYPLLHTSKSWQTAHQILQLSDPERWDAFQEPLSELEESKGIKQGKLLRQLKRGR